MFITKELCVFPPHQLACVCLRLSCPISGQMVLKLKLVIALEADPLQTLFVACDVDVVKLLIDPLFVALKFVIDLALFSVNADFDVDTGFTLE